MNDQNVERFVIQVLSEALEVSPNEIGLDADLLEDLGADSLMILEVMARIENDFKINIDQSKIAEMISPNAICGIIRNSVAAAA